MASGFEFRLRGFSFRSTYADCISQFVSEKHALRSFHGQSERHSDPTITADGELQSESNGPSIISEIWSVGKGLHDGWKSSDGGKDLLHILLEQCPCGPSYTIFFGKIAER